MNADDERKAMGQDKGGPPADGDFDERLKRLRTSLDQGKAERAGRSGLADNTGWAQALKLGSEFVAAVIVGVVIGYGIDYFLGTGPWGMAIFLLLGFAAGTLNVMRSAGVISPAQIDRPRNRDGKDS